MHWRWIIVMGLPAALSLGLASCANKDRTAATTSSQSTDEAADGQPQEAASDRTVDDAPPVPGARIEAISLLGDKLYVVDQPSTLDDKREAELAAAQAEYDRDPHNVDAIIWLGRRLAYLGRFNDAIAVYTNGLAIHADSPRLLRHRGHRYITIRMFHLAQDDLERAAVLAQGLPDEVELDGQPNASNIPTSTLQTNIDYHLGLARYLSGDYDAAAQSYRNCLEKSGNDDMRAAAAYWLYLSLRRANKMSEAAGVLKTIHGEMDIIENHSYHRLLLMFKGELSPAQVAPIEGDQATLDDISIDEATVGYGIGVWHELRGERGLARLKWREVIDTTNWAAFGYIASEADIARGR